MKRLTALMIVLSVLLCSCSAVQEAPEQKQYTATFLTLFDTVTSIVGRADSEEAFQAIAQTVHDELEVYHRLFDIYNDYEGVNNLKTINDCAGIEAVKVDEPIIALLLDCKEFYALTGGKVNAAMGSVLALWHEARNDGLSNPAEAYLPDDAQLEQASLHTDLSAVIIDEAASTVYISNPDVQLDVGAIAKGWATQRAADHAPSGLLISLGGNVCATGPKDSDGTPWVVGVRDPNGEAEDFLHTLYVRKGSVVTSGDYQRAYMVDGQLYHHIIDPATLYPSGYWRSVTVVCSDSGMADALSTALFLLPYQEGLVLLEKCGAEAMWMASDGSLLYSPGFEDLIRT